VSIGFKETGFGTSPVPSMEHVLDLPDRLLDLLPAAVYVCDGDGLIVRYNRRATDLWGRAPRIGDPAERFCGSHHLYRLDGGLLPHAECPMADTLRTGIAVRNQDVVIERPDGSRVVASVNIDAVRNEAGAIIGALNCFHDITERKRAEEDARTSRRDLEDFFENAVIPMHLVGPDGTILRANRAELALLGYAREEYVGRNIAEFHADRAAIDSILASLLRGEILDGYPARLRAKDGTTKYVLINSSVRFENGEPVHTRCVSLDMTAFQRAEEARHESEARLAAELDAARQLQEISVQLIGEHGIEGLYDKLVDAATIIMRADYASMQMLYPERGSGGELRLLAFRGFNPQAAKFWEWVRADSESTCGAALRTGKQVIVPDVTRCDFMAGTEDLETYLQTGIHAVQTTPLVSRSGRLLGMISTHWRNPHDPTESDLRRLDVLARLAADLIERFEANTALRESEARFNGIVAQAGAGIAATDLTGRFVQVNDRYCEMLGYAAAELYGMRMQDVTHADDLPRNLEMFVRLAQTGTGFVVEKRYVRKDGTIMWVNNSVTGVRDAGGKLSNAVAVSIDITERVIAQEQQNLLLREMNHRVKNLFAVTGSVVALSARSARTPKEMADALHSRLRALTNAHELTQPGLIEDARFGQDTTLHALLRAIFAPYDDVAQPQNRQRFVVSGPDVPVGQAVVTSLALLLHEMTTNAVKYGALSSPTGHVAIDSALTQEELQLIWTERGGPRVDGQPSGEGFGGLLTERVIKGQFGGRLIREWRVDGLIVRLSIPLQRLAQ
jgi:PAS domain S-box-containing protein